VGLGWLPGTPPNSFGYRYSEATDVDGNGSVIIGFSGPVLTSPSKRGFVWTEEYGMEELQKALVDRHGLGPALAGWHLAAPWDISSNGQFITGTGINPDGDIEAWLVRLDQPFVPVPKLTGDFNRDGTVDAADYIVWRNGLGTTYTQADYAAWRANFGATAAGAAAVANVVQAPEPPSLALVGLNAFVVSAGLRRRPSLRGRLR
jgi:hypothetical protein